MGNLDSLPVDIIQDILKCLEIDSVIQYRLVSRTWNYHVYHCLLDYVEETQVELDRKMKRLKSGRYKGLKFVKSVEKTIEFVNQGIINARKYSGGPSAVFEFGELLHLKQIEKAVNWYLRKQMEALTVNFKSCNCVT